jgi:hypothetical protein
MPSTYTLIASNVLSTAAASVTFSAIPSTYTDLVFRVSVRNSLTQEDMLLRINNDSSTLYSRVQVRGNGTSASSSINSSQTSIKLENAVVGSGYTANTFSNHEIYIPNYTVSQNRQISSFAVIENNATEAFQIAHAGLYRSSTAITQVDLIASSGTFVASSSFYLYGIKNS